MNTIRRLLVAILVCLGLAVLAASPASAQTYTGVTPPALGNVLGDSGSAGDPVGQVLAAQATRSGGTQAEVPRLAFTGADIASLVAMAGALIGVGLVLARRARVRSLPDG